jgi:hypothetical protein
MKPQSRLNREDQGLVASGFGPEPIVAYILSLGVVMGKRRNGIGSMLLQQLIHYLQSDHCGCKCRAVFLHVLSSNSDAIKFYESQNFSPHRFLPLYYFIAGQCLDGISYVRYLNGGRAPTTLSLVIKMMFESASSCTMRLFHALRSIAQIISRKIRKMPVRFLNQIPRNFRKQNSSVKYHQIASA